MSALAERFRAAIVGLGRMGRRHLEAYLRNPKVVVEACSDSNPQALEFLKDHNVDCRRYTDWHQMLRDGTFDLLSVVTNAPSHAEITIEAARSKVCRIICEKPMATSIKDAKQMIDVARTNGVSLAINYSRRWSHDYQELKRKINDGELGKLCHIHAVCGGGQLACNGSHFLDLMRYLSDAEPSSVLGFVDKSGTPNPRGAQFKDPGAFGILGFGNGMRGFLDMYEDLGIPPRIEIVGSIGRVTIDESRNIWSIDCRRGKDREEPLGKYDLPLNSEPLHTERLDHSKLLEATINEILRDERISCTGTDGLASLQMIMGFHVSDLEGNIKANLPLPLKYEGLTVNFT